MNRSAAILARESFVDASARWIRDGYRMAQQEPATVLVSIEAKHRAECAQQQTRIHRVKALGHTVLQKRDGLDQALQVNGFSALGHLRDLAQGKVDLMWAIGLTILNVVLALFILLGVASTWLVIPLALLVLATALPVEEFFEAHAESNALREGIFLTLSMVALLATFWLGSVRGLFLAALAPVDAGPASHALNVAYGILRHVLGVLACVSEIVAGYKIHRARRQLLSETALAIRERDRCNETLIELATALRTAQVQPDVKRSYREIGARQFLASQPQQPHHLKRAALGAGIALAILLGLMLLASVTSAAPVQHNVVILIDLTASTRPEAFKASVAATERVLVAASAGSRVSVVGIADEFGHSAMLFDRTLPVDPGYLGLAGRVAREQLLAEWRRAATHLRLTYQRTDIIGALAYLSYLRELPPDRTHLVVFSDLRQSQGLDFERVAEVRVADTLARLKRSGSIPVLTGVHVHLLGVDPWGKSARYLETLKQFWYAFFREAGADVRTFSVNTELPRF